MKQVLASCPSVTASVSDCDQKCKIVDIAHTIPTIFGNQVLPMPHYSYKRYVVAEINAHESPMPKPAALGGLDMRRDSAATVASIVEPPTIIGQPENTTLADLIKSSEITVT